MSSKKIICVTGADGSGKSTLIGNLQQYFPDAVVVTIWDALEQQPTPFSSKQEVDAHLCSLKPGDRVMFLANAMKIGMDKAMNSDTGTILINAYWYKYFVSEAALGASAELLKMQSELFPVPSVVIELQLSAYLRAGRKQRFSRYECGLSATPSKEAFIAFQEKAEVHWKKFRHKNWIQFDASLSPSQLTEQAIKIISK